MSLCDTKVSEAETLDGGLDVVGGFGPAQWRWIGIDGVDIAEDGGFEVLGGSVNAAAQLLFGEEGEEALDLVEPGGRGRRVMDLPAGMAGEPVAGNAASAAPGSAPKPACSGTSS